MLKQILCDILIDLNKAEKDTKESLLKRMIDATLNTSYDRYCNNLKINYDYLLTRDNLKVLKNIVKMKKESATN